MNAVKRCLTVLAVALVAGACGGDQTAEDAGASPHIRATPGAVWTRNGSAPATFLIEAVDKLGGSTQGSWAVGTVVGPMTVAIDPTFQETSTGPLGMAARFVVTPTAEGEGSVTITGTGAPSGGYLIPVRIAPDTNAFDVDANDSTPALFQSITLTAPAGIAFTPATTVRFYSGTQARDTANGGLSFPVVQSMTTDSSSITFMPGPGAKGQARISGLVSRSTPTLSTTARSAAVFAQVPTVDTSNFSFVPAFVSTGTRATATVFDTLVLTAPANYRFLPSTTIEFWRTVSGAYTVANGTATPVTVVSTDSTKLRVLVAPGARGQLKVRNVAFRNEKGINFSVRGIAGEVFDLRSGVNGPDTTNFAFTFNKTSPVAEGDTVTVTAPAGMMFLGGTASLHATSAATMSGGDSARIVGFGADSTTIKVLLAPGASGKFRYSALARKDNPKIFWQARGTTISAAAAPAVVASLNPATANMNDTVVVGLDPAGPYRFRPSSTALVGGFVGMIASVSGDSLTMKFLAPPGQAAGPVTLTGIRYANLPTFQVQAATASNLTTNAATSLGGDDPKAGPAIFSISAPNAAGKIVGFWDQATLGASDYTGDGGVSAQYYRINGTRNGAVNFKVDWSQGTASTTDIDFLLVEDDGAYDSFVGGVTSGAASGKPENATYTLQTGHTYVLAVIDFAGNIAATTAVKVTMLGQ